MRDILRVMYEDLRLIEVDWGQLIMGGIFMFVFFSLALIGSFVLSVIAGILGVSVPVLIIVSVISVLLIIWVLNAWSRAEDDDDE